MPYIATYIEWNIIVPYFLYSLYLIIIPDFQDRPSCYLLAPNNNENIYMPITFKKG